MEEYDKLRYDNSLYKDGTEIVQNVQGTTEVQFIMYAIKDILMEVENGREIMVALDMGMEKCLVILYAVKLC